VPTAGSTLRVTVTPWRGLKAGLAGSLWLDQQGHLSSDASQGADFGLFTADAFGCYAWVPRRSFEVSPCALVELGRISATGEGATKNSSSTALWLGLGLGVEGRWELTRWLALAAELDGMVPTPGQSFSIKGGGTVHATSVVAARGHFGPEVRF
jgi:hypothetical protein